MWKCTDTVKSDVFGALQSQRGVWGDPENMGVRGWMWKWCSGRGGYGCTAARSSLKYFVYPSLSLQSN